ncbi:MAG: SxtJ family membrane protein [Gammaproteobacteria bacterium]
MNLADKQATPDRNDLKRFGLTMGILFAGIFGIFFPWLFDTAFPYWPWLLALVFILWALISPLTLKFIYSMWIRFGLLMNHITTPILLGIEFYMIITPMGLVMRMCGRDEMRLKLDYDKVSYRRESQCRSKETLERPF